MPDQPVITPALEDRARAENAEGLLDVVVELADDPQAAMTVPAQQESFERAASPVADAIAQLGGDVVDKAWINRTLRARVPAKGLEQLSTHAAVTALDVPHQIEPD
jgi:hypothetical protein